VFECRAVHRGRDYRSGALVEASNCDSPSQWSAIRSSFRKRSTGPLGQARIELKDDRSAWSSSVIPT
jgi:hypothetical protein